MTVTSAISRSATTGFLSRSRSMVRSAPPEIWRARWAASRTRSNLFGILSTQSSTVTRAIRRSAKTYSAGSGIWDVRKAAPIACGLAKSQGKRAPWPTSPPVVRASAADPRRDRRQPARADRERRGAAPDAARADRRARSSRSSMLMYMFNPDRAGERVRDALTAAARRGVEVEAADRRLRLRGAGRILHRPRRSRRRSIASSTRARAAAICFATTRSWSSIDEADAC